jgi:hypothetical protein
MARRVRNVFSERGPGCFRSVLSRALSDRLWIQSVSALRRPAREPLRCSLRADALIVDLVRLVKSLPRAARVVWNQAYRRDFNVGIQAGLKPHSYELSLKPETLKLVSSVNARVVVTIYAAEVPRREP